MADPLKSFGVACPMCGAGYGEVGDKPALDLDLNDLASITCGECSETFSPQKAVKVAAENARRWAAVARWVAMARQALETT